MSDDFLSESDLDAIMRGVGAEEVTFRPTQKMTLYHAATPKKAALYRATGRIVSPVRGFTTEKAAMAWAMKVGRTVILEFDAHDAHKLPDHHNKFGESWWNDADVTHWRCSFSAGGEA